MCTTFIRVDKGGAIEGLSAVGWDPPSLGLLSGSETARRCNTEPLHPAYERRPLPSQTCSGAERARGDTTGNVQRAQDLRAFRLVQNVIKASAMVLTTFCNFVAGEIGGQHRTS